MTAEAKWTRVFAACVYFSVGLFATVIGGHDALAAPEVSSRSGGLLLLFAGFILIAISFALLIPTRKWSPRRRWVPRAGMYAAGIGILIGGSFMFTQAAGPDGGPESIVLLAAIAVPLTLCARAGWGVVRLLAGAAALLALGYMWLRGGDHDERVVIWVAIIVVSGLAGFALARTNPPRMGVSVSRVVLGAVGFVSLSAVIGVAQFWYTTQYLPANEKVSLSVETELHRLGSYGRKAEVVELALTVHNTSQTPAEILSSVYRVSGSSTQPVSHSDLEMQKRLGRPLIGGQTSSRYRRNSAWDMVQVGRIFGLGWWLDADEKFSRVALIQVPRGRYDTLRAQAEVLIAKRRSLSLDYGSPRVNWLNHSRWHVRGIKMIWPIEETSWFRDLTRSDRELRVKWITANDSESRVSRFPQVRGAIDRVGEEVSADEFFQYQERTGELYGLADTIATREIPLGIRTRR